MLTAFYLNPLTPGAFCQKRIFWTFWRFSGLDMGQISSNLLKKAFATWQRAFLSTSIAFYDMFARACAEILKFSFRLSFFSFSFLFVVVIDLLLGLLSVQKILRKHHGDGQFLPWSSHVQLRKILPRFFHSNSGAFSCIFQAQLTQSL